MLENRDNQDIGENVKNRYNDNIDENVENITNREIDANNVNFKNTENSVNVENNANKDIGVNRIINANREIGVNNKYGDNSENRQIKDKPAQTILRIPGIPDSDFIRGDVPMTKEEIRVLSVCKLHLDPNSVVYDIGSGTGSVAVEIARLSPNITVYAVEVNDEGIGLINQNAANFGCKNIHAVHALAPDGLEKLPIPTHAFIGGSKGNLSSIIDALRKKNPKIRIVGTAVTLETVAEMQNALKNLSVSDADVVQVSVSRAEKIGSYHMLKANNPVFIYSFTLSEAE